MDWSGMTVNRCFFFFISHDGRFWRASVLGHAGTFTDLSSRLVPDYLLFRAIMPCSWKLHNGLAKTAAIPPNKATLHSPTRVHKFGSSAEYPEAGWFDSSGLKEAGVHHACIPWRCPKERWCALTDDWRGHRR
ncbi:hypothetical protein CGRA01v4_03005 [Colletotrichum graminicola]|nr:hypothetical protein CGRA01v4_03005 [Colletotrichum graminicola]